MRLVELTEPVDDRIPSLPLHVAGTAPVVDRGIGQEERGELLPSAMIDRVTVATEQLMDQDDVGAVEHGATVVTPLSSLGCGEARVTLK